MAIDLIARFRASRSIVIARWIAIAMAPLLAYMVAASVASPQQAYSAGLATACVVLWLAQLVPVFVPTLVLLALGPVLLGHEFTTTRVLGWALDPVLALFFGGLALGAAAERHGVAEALAHRVVAWSRGDRVRLITLAMAITALLSMWLSNTAAATLMLATLVPLADRLHDANLKRALLLAIAAGANLGGIATPIGTAPNALAISALGVHAPSFLGWMALGLPLSIASLVVARFLIIRRCGINGSLPVTGEDTGTGPKLSKRGHAVGGLIAAAVLLWLSEPLTGLSSSTVALGLAAVLFSTRLLEREDLGRFDWGTLFLIAGGIAMGRMLDQTGVMALATNAVPWHDIPPWALASSALGVAMLCSSVLSNTATATLVLTAMTAIAPDRPELAIVLVLGTSFAFPFPVSTPPNAMIAGYGIGTRDLIGLGTTMMVIAGIVLALIGPTVAVMILR
jgi:solute carrier family 13 (sodium-dependent dicarboxylate transporter), member 2/3/5